VNALISVNETATAPGNDSSSTPVISADGSTSTFRSLASDLVVGDLNDTLDVFFSRTPRVDSVDSDADGMDDAYETAYFGDLSHDGLADSDGDGVSDLMEYKTGTNPMNPASRFARQAGRSPGTGRVVISWAA